ncbi:hypothetical protein L345_12413, partial [Ophiophagus hannah]
MRLLITVLSGLGAGSFSQFVLNQPASLSGSPGGTIQIPCTISRTFSQVVLTQLESVSGSPGATIRITCAKNSGTLDTGDSSWYQQKPGNTPKLLIYRDSSRASGIPERFSGFIENSKTSAVLTISNLQAEDEAYYYCLYYIGSDGYTMIQCHRRVEQKPCRSFSQLVLNQPASVSGSPGGTIQIPCTVSNRFSGATDSSRAILTITGSWGQFILTQPASLLVALGGRAVISCTRNIASINKYHVSWYQEKPNGLPKLLIYQHNKRPPGIPE